MTDAELIARLRVNDPVCEEHFTANIAADRIEALIAERDAAEAKLAKAVKVLEDLVRDCEADYPPSHGAIKYFCRATLAEIKGESHE